MNCRLLILACSQTKRSDPGLLPAIERYDGPAFRIVRKYRRENSSCAQSLLIQILSAKYGLLEIDQMIPSYNYKMTARHAESLQVEVSNQLKFLVEHTCCQEVFIYASQAYLTALGNYNFYLPSHTSTVTLAGTPGYKLAELHRWLYHNQLPQNKMPISIKSEVVRIKGITIDYTRDQIIDIVQQSLNSEVPSINYSSWYTIINGQKVAIKWLISRLTGLRPNAFHTDDAKRAIRDLGFEVFTAIDSR